MSSPLPPTGGFPMGPAGMSLGSDPLPPLEGMQGEFSPLPPMGSGAPSPLGFAGMPPPIPRPGMEMGMTPPGFGATHLDGPYPHMSALPHGLPMRGQPMVSPHLAEEHSAFLQDIGRDRLPHAAVGGGDDHGSFLFGAGPAAGSTDSAVHGSAAATAAGPANSHATSFLFGDGGLPQPQPQDSHQPGAADVVQSGLAHIDLSALQTLKKAVLVTGGMCSKMFGIAIVGFLAFQSMQANMREQEKREREQSLQYGYSMPR